MNWRDGGMYGQMQREIVTEDGGHPIAMVRTRQYRAGEGTEPWPEGKANFHLILQAPRMLEALEAIVNLDPAYWCQTEPGNAVCDQCKEIARAAIAAAKGESDEKIVAHASHR